MAARNIAVCRAAGHHVPGAGDAVVARCRATPWWVTGLARFDHAVAALAALGGVEGAVLAARQVASVVSQGLAGLAPQLESLALLVGIEPVVVAQLGIHAGAATASPARFALPAVVVVPAAVRPALLARAGRLALALPDDFFKLPATVHPVQDPILAHGVCVGLAIAALAGRVVGCAPAVTHLQNLLQFPATVRGVGSSIDAVGVSMRLAFLATVGTPTDQPGRQARSGQRQSFVATHLTNLLVMVSSTSLHTIPQGQVDRDLSHIVIFHRPGI
jgi:hypothetical protein